MHWLHHQIRRAEFVQGNPVSAGPRFGVQNKRFTTGPRRQTWKCNFPTRRHLFVEYKFLDRHFSGSSRVHSNLLVEFDRVCANAVTSFSVSEDWFFGHAARKLGSRITMCSAIFVETETPSAVLFSSGGARGGFGEMTIFKQRFYRWNFFFVNGMFYNMAYILGSWKLGFWEIGAKIFVFQEVYETLLYLLAPFVLPVSLVVRPAFCGYLLAGHSFYTSST